MTESRKVPKLRFPEFRGDWEQRKVFEITSSYSGGTPKAGTAEYYDGDIPFIRSGEIYDNSTELFLSELGMNNSSAKMVHTGDILYALYGATSGEVSRARIDGAINQAILAIIPNEEINADYLVEWFRKEKDKITDTYLQGGQGNLSAQIIKGLEVAIPADDEQKKIGTYFAQLNDLITLHQRKLESLKKVKKSFLQKMFPKNGEKIPEIRFPEFSGDWEQRKVKDIASFFKGNGYSKCDLCEEGTPIILYGRLYTNYQFTINDVDTFAEKKKGSVFSTGNEVIVPASGETAEDIARASAVIKQGVILGGDLNILRPHSNINSQFLALLLSCGKPQIELSKKAQGKSIVHVHNSDIQEIEISYPLMKEQEQIVSVFSRLDKTITLHQRKLEVLNKLKKAMLQNMFV